MSTTKKPRRPGTNGTPTKSAAEMAREFIAEAKRKEAEAKRYRAAARALRGGGR